MPITCKGELGLIEFPHTDGLGPEMRCCPGLCYMGNCGLATRGTRKTSSKYRSRYVRECSPFAREDLPSCSSSSIGEHVLAKLSLVCLSRRRKGESDDSLMIINPLKCGDTMREVEARCCSRKANTAS